MSCFLRIDQTAMLKQRFQLLFLFSNTRRFPTTAAQQISRWMIKLYFIVIRKRTWADACCIFHCVQFYMYEYINNHISMSPLSRNALRPKRMRQIEIEFTSHDVRKHFNGSTSNAEWNRIFSFHIFCDPLLVLVPFENESNERNCASATHCEPDKNKYASVNDIAAK